MKKIIFLFVLFFLFLSNTYALNQDCINIKKQSISHNYRNILIKENSSYLKIVDKVLFDFRKKLALKTNTQKIEIYQKIYNKIDTIIPKITKKILRDVLYYLKEEIFEDLYYLKLEVCDNKNSILNIKYEKIGDKLIITGELSPGVEKVVVTYENEKGEFPIDVYKLHNFHSGDRKFTYNASYKYKNLDNGTNIYTIKIYKNSGETETKKIIYKENSIIKNQENISKKYGKYCVLDTCLDIKSGGIKESGNKFMQEKTKSYILKDKTEIFKQIEEGLSIEKIFIQKIGNYFVKNFHSLGCGSSSIKQDFYDSNANIVSESEISNFLKSKYNLNSLKFGNYIYRVKFEFKENISLMDNSIVEADNKIGSLDEVKEFIKSKISKKTIAKKYIFHFEKSGTKFDLLYEASFKQPEKLVYLGNDKEWLNKNITIDGDLINLGITNKILSSFGESNVRGVTDSEGKRIFKVNSSLLPVFKVKKFDNSGLYMLYPTNGYKIVAFVEMCKPAVYIYNSEKTDNILFLETNKGNYFTKLIPNFTGNKYWNFSSKNGKVEVNGKKYDYLYYAIKVKNYKHNKNGWIVSGKNIKKFFLDKLEKINFNQKEKQDFLDYWLKKFDKDKYYFVSFKYKQDLEKLVSLRFSKKPNKIFRVLLDSYELEKLTSNKQKFLYSKVGDKFDKFLIKRFNRKNNSYEVFEWGGVLEKKGKYFIY